MEKIIMQDPEIYKQIGELTGRFNTFEANMSKEFSEVKQAIREQNNVPYPVFEKHVLEHTKLAARVDAVEDTLKIKEHTITGKLAQFLDSAIVKIIGTGVVGVVLFAIYLNYQAQIDSISEKVDNVTRLEQVNKGEQYETQSNH